jgi:NTP pyrophosphatase (non-canonical NTP hydrolase)
VSKLIERLNEIQKVLWQQYLKDEKDKIFAPHGEVGDIAELGLVCEEIGEAQNSIRKRKGIENLEEECGDIIVRTICFMSRKGIDLQTALNKVHAKNVARNRKGLFIETKVEGEK